MRKLATIAIALAIASSVAAPGFAAGRGSAEDQRACTPDVFRLCSQFIPDADKITVCLKANMSKLSPACKAVMSR